jgi:hypothetical protein
MAYTSHEGQSLQVESTFLTLVSGGDFRSGAPGNDQFLLSGTRVSRDATPSAAGNDCPPKRVQLQAEQMHRDGGKGLKRRSAATGPQHRRAVTRVVSFPQVLSRFFSSPRSAFARGVAGLLRLDIDFYTFTT